MKKLFLIILIACSFGAKAQKIDSIFVNLYTDSLKKGTYNYINVDGLTAAGNYLPLDTTHLKFSSSAGTFYGNSLWIDTSMLSGAVKIQISLKANPASVKNLVLYIKTGAEEKLKTNEEILAEMRKPEKKKKS